MAAKRLSLLWEANANKKLIDSFPEIKEDSDEKKLELIKAKIGELLLPDVSKRVNAEIAIKQKTEVREIQRLFFSNDVDYDNQRSFFSLRIQQRPLFIIQPASNEEVVNILNFLTYRGLSVRVVGGRHSTQLVNPQVMIDVSLFDHISLCLETEKIVVGGGATQGDVNFYLFNKLPFAEAAGKSRFSVDSNTWTPKVRAYYSEPSNLLHASVLDDIARRLTNGALEPDALQDLIRIVDGLSASIGSGNLGSEGDAAVATREAPNLSAVHGILGLSDLETNAHPELTHSLSGLNHEALTHLDLKLFALKVDRTVGRVYSDFGHMSRGPIFGSALETNAFAGGSAGSVGVGGISTAGGVGTLKRTYGLTVDHIVNFVVVLPGSAYLDEGDGNELPARTVIASKTQNSDLFWALRGGGGNNFGIITSITYDILVDVPQCIKYSYVEKFSGKDDDSARKQVIAEIMRTWAGSVDTRPKEFNEQMDLMAPNTGSDNMLVISGLYLLPTNTTTREQAITTINTEFDKYRTKTATFNFTFLDVEDYSKTYTELVHNRKYSNFQIIQAFFVDTFDATRVLENFTKIDFYQDGSKSMSFELLGGRIQEYASQNAKDVLEYGIYAGKSFAGGNCRYFMDVSSNWNSVENSQNRESWVKNVVDNVVNHNLMPTTQLPLGPLAYVGFPITFPDVVKVEHKYDIYYGDVSYPELCRLKQRKFDAFNVLTDCGTIPQSN